MASTICLGKLRFYFKKYLFLYVNLHKLNLLDLATLFFQIHYLQKSLELLKVYLYPFKVKFRYMVLMCIIFVVRLIND